ncbi:MAG: Type II secretory pathway component PulK-like protein [Pseudomonadota bacterium]
MIETRRSREGMILLNVLLIMAVASVAVLVMVTSQDIEVQRSTRLREAAQAGAYARAGELSAVTVLRRDALTAAGTDNLSEPWAAIGQQAIAVPGGRFSLSIEDEQARFNLNSMVSGDAQPIALFQQIGAAAGVEPAVLIRIASIVRVAGPLSDLGLLRTGGVSPDDLARLEPWIVALPTEAMVNLNTVGEPLLSVMTGDPASARALIQRRAQAGLLQPADLATAGAGVLPGTGYTSDHYRVVTTVTVGDTGQILTSRLERFRRAGGADVLVRGRERTATAG